MKPITLSDAIYEIESQPHSVISKLYLLNLLGSVLSEDCDKCLHLPIYTMETIGRGLQDVVREVSK